MKILLVRHGQSTWNAIGKWQGQANPPLSELGQKQAISARDSFWALGIQTVVSSDLDRAAKTAEILIQGIPSCYFRLEPQFRERESGEFTGLTETEMRIKFPLYFSSGKLPPRYETDQVFLERVKSALISISSSYVDTPEIAIICHAGVIRIIETLGNQKVVNFVPNLGGLWISLNSRNEIDVGKRIELGDKRLLTKSWSI